MSGIGILLVIILVIAAIFVIGYISISNSLNRAIVKIDEADSGIDVALLKRHDVLTKMLDVVKAYTKHEKETLFEIVNLRKGMTMQEKSAASAEMDQQFKSLNIVAENYPQLLSSENYKTLQLAIADTEEHLQAARRLYNSNVSIYNQMLVTSLPDPSLAFFYKNIFFGCFNLKTLNCSDNYLLKMFNQIKEFNINVMKNK